MKGVGKGNTNNPNGRPAGAKDRLSLSVRVNIIDFLNGNIEAYFAALNGLKGIDYVRCFTELLKLVVPRPLNEEESNLTNINNEFIKRLFNK